MTTTQEEQLAQALAAPTWRPLRGKDVLVTFDGRIVGEVGDLMSGGYYAEANKRQLGRFYTESDAKRAVENAL